MQTLEQIPATLAPLSRPVEQLFYAGDVRLLDLPMVAVVGSRRPSAYTRQATVRLCQALSAHGVIVVSGGAMGVDALAHQGAFPNTIAVLANGLDIFYPKVNESLLRSVQEKALLLSEYPQGTRAMKHSFVERNRIVVGLSCTVVIAQAEVHSGSMHSARIAQELGKPLYVLPQRLGESDGTNQLLKEKKAELIDDLDAFARMFGQKEETSDALLAFCAKEPRLDKCLEKFGNAVYAYELEGRLSIEGLMVVVHG
ncbi:MAG: DNA-protecting protein DprA [Campylobacterales bacterium]|nr:DNA-protecting protein DprA [Campylobacterales bacterium]